MRIGCSLRGLPGHAPVRLYLTLLTRPEPAAVLRARGELAGRFVRCSFACVL